MLLILLDCLTYVRPKHSFDFIKLILPSAISTFLLLIRVRKFDTKAIYSSYETTIRTFPTSNNVKKRRNDAFVFHKPYMDIF